MKKLIGYSLLALTFAAPLYAMEGEGDRHAQHLKEVDTDGDGKVSKTEFLAKAEKRFAEADANGDGFIVKEEHKAMRAKWKAKHPKMGKPPMDAAK